MSFLITTSFFYFLLCIAELSSGRVLCMMSLETEFKLSEDLEVLYSTDSSREDSMLIWYFSKMAVDS